MSKVDFNRVIWYEIESAPTEVVFLGSDSYMIWPCMKDWTGRVIAIGEKQIGIIESKDVKWWTPMPQMPPISY